MERFIALLVVGIIAGNEYEFLYFMFFNIILE